MLKSMTGNSDKTHHVKVNASEKDSVSLPFFCLDKNYGPREYDTSNKVLSNSRPKQSKDNICIKLLSNCVTSVQDGKSVGVCYLHRKNVYKSGAALKGYINKCREKGKDLEKYELSVINHPPSENGTRIYLVTK